MKACIPETALETKRPIPYEIGRCQECLVQKYRHHHTQSTRCFKSTTEAVDLA